MKKKIQLLLSRILLFTLVFTRVNFAVPVFAQEAVPTVPPPPAMHDTAPTSPPPPTAPPVPPAGTLPTLPTAPTYPPAQPTSPSQPTSPPLPSEGTGSSTDPSITPFQSAVSDTPTPVAGSDNTTANPQVNEGAQTVTNSGSDANPSNINDPANITTGAGSVNSATETVNQNLEVLNKNLADMQNKIDQISSTGFNYANLNTLDGQVFTGNTLSTLNLLNKLNSNMTGLGGFSVFNIYDTHTGDIVFDTGNSNVSDSFTSGVTISKNEGTGAFSTNNADAANTFTVKEANGNDANLTNNIELQSISGGNSASMNTGNGIIKTGSATALGNIVNLANTNINVSKWLFGVVNIFGTLAGNIVLPQDSGIVSTPATNTGTLVENKATGAFSTNSSTLTDTTNTTFTNSNIADVNSVVDVSSNSGNNSSSMNTGGGYVQTGSTEASISNSTIANINTTKEDDTVWMVIVNEMGKWVGHIYGSPWGSTSASNALPIAQSVSGPGVNSFNTATGAFSNNSANYTNTYDSSVENVNDAKIQNNIKVVSDTGNNTASTNTGAGVIQTGDAKAGLNLVNMANTNITAKKFVAVLVNVLGNFLGDIVTPGSNYTSSTPTPTRKPVITPTGQQPGNTNTITPTPTYPQIPVFTGTTGGIGGVGELAADIQTNTSVYQDDSIPTYYYQYPAEYIQAVAQVNNQKSIIIAKRKTGQTLTGDLGLLGSATSVKRGIYISPAFAKATETTIAGVLLGGFTWKVDHNWLSIIPFALFFVFLRRRRRYQFRSYFKHININSLLEVLL